MISWLWQTLPWYAWLLLWPPVSIIVAPFVGRFLRLRRERMERDMRDNAVWQSETRNRWRNPGDEEWAE